MIQRTKSAEGLDFDLVKIIFSQMDAERRLH